HSTSLDCGGGVTTLVESVLFESLFRLPPPPHAVIARPEKAMRIAVEILFLLNILSYVPVNTCFENINTADDRQQKIRL
ncbi:hypothetical protein, partial [Streptomyces galilaeus]|uniref:hypothetical protein n=1 Tax=Streptomyces galilaeus TaxID=33899 RepID=UPI0038F64406